MIGDIAILIVAIIAVIGTAILYLISHRDAQLKKEVLRMYANGFNQQDITMKVFATLKSEGENVKYYEVEREVNEIIIEENRRKDAC